MVTRRRKTTMEKMLENLVDVSRAGDEGKKVSTYDIETVVESMEDEIMAEVKQKLRKKGYKIIRS